MNNCTEIQAGNNLAEPTPCPLWRRLTAIVYDSLILICLVFILWQPLPLIPDSFWPNALSGQLVRLLYLLSIVFLFFGWFWTHGGQTLGMRSWRIAIETNNGTTLNWADSSRRFFAAMVSWATCGTGFLWSLFDPKARTWHDIFSATRLVIRPSNRESRNRD